LILIISVFACLTITSSQAFGEDILYSIARNDDQLRIVDPITALTISQTTITLAGQTVTGGTGLATDPTTGDLWATLKIEGQDGRELVTIDPDTGEAISKGDTGLKLSGIAFDSSGTLYGITGDGHIPMEQASTLFIISTTDSSFTQKCPIGIPFVFGGESLGYNSDDNFLYHGSGGVAHVDPITFERVDSFPAIPSDQCNTTVVTLSLNEMEAEAQAMTYWKTEGSFLWVELFTTTQARLIKLTPAGFDSNIGMMDHRSLGLAFKIHELSPPPPELNTVDFSGRFAGRFNDDSFNAIGKYMIDGEKFKHVKSNGNFDLMELDGPCNVVTIYNGIWDFGDGDTLNFEAEGENCSKKFFKRFSGTFTVIGGTGIFENSEGEGEINLINGRKHLLGTLSGTLGIPEV